jgi:hypothetical protein
MKYFTILLIWISSIPTSAVSKDWSWAKEVGISNYSSSISKLAALGEDQYLFAGYSTGGFYFDSKQMTTNAGQELVLGIINELGELSSFQVFQVESNQFEISDLLVDGENNCFLSIMFRGGYVKLKDSTIFSAGGNDGLVIKFDSIYDIKWFYHTAQPQDETIKSMDLDASGNLYLAVNSYSQYLIRKLNKNGIMLWESSAIAQNNNSSVIISKLLVLPNAQIIVLGSIYGTVEILDYGIVESLNEELAFMLLLDAAGRPKAVKQDTFLSAFTDAAIIGDRIYVCASKEIEDYDEEYPYFLSLRILQLNFNLEALLYADFEGLFSRLQGFFGSVGCKLTTDSRGNLYLYGSHLGFKIGENQHVLPNVYEEIEHGQLFVLKLDTQLVVSENFTIAGQLFDYISSMLIVDSATVILAGDFQSQELHVGDHTLYNNGVITPFIFGHGGTVFYFRQMKGFVARTQRLVSNTISKNLPALVTLHPNPSQDHFFLRSEAFTENPVQIQIFSTDGKLLSQQNLLPNGNSLRVETAALPPGMYIVTTIVNEQISSARFLKQ